MRLRSPACPSAVRRGEELLPLSCVPREEAKEMWEKREAEWARERSARDRLMAEVTPLRGGLAVPGGCGN